MSSSVRRRVIAVQATGIVAAAVLLAAGGAGLAQQNTGNPPAGAAKPGDEIELRSITPQVTPRQQYTGREEAGKLLQVPVSNLFPGSVAVDPDIKNPVAGDPAAIERGMEHFKAFNCVGCHAPNGGGGEGPALSNEKWIYGSKPAEIYLTIVQGRPNGMPAWGAMLPDQTVWELVAYIESIAEKPDGKFGKTYSLSLPSPKIEQVPAEAMQTTKPWDHTEPFSFGQRPKSQGGTPKQPQEAASGSAQGSSDSQPAKQ